jgi:hypothetical protein
MGVFSTNLTEIASGGLISSSHASDLYGVLSGSIREDVIISGSFTVSEGTILFYTASLPTSDPAVNGQLWRSGSYLMISTGSI